MDFQKLCYVGIYHGYLIAISEGYWEVMCLKRYYMVDGDAGDSTAAFLGDEGED